MNKTTEQTINLILAMTALFTGATMWGATSPLLIALTSIAFAASSSLLLMHFVSETTDAKDEQNN
ncbi:hypothetical protein [Bifidobacterium sp. SO1]|uniref:hypothetical protein n=1 Tax=Bifidobacterium sp. SO1 TaxID=2809029 RepID=UPI001BDBBABD|nr:hypothetical protein [Bifidobacterium sp. SO1]MBT1162156.1 hypothetical protein [Bifidobacterium sp. SO1]